MTILVTGAAGTVGRRVVAQLRAAGHLVIGLDVAWPRGHALSKGRGADREQPLNWEGRFLQDRGYQDRGHQDRPNRDRPLHQGHRLDCGPLLHGGRRISLGGFLRITGAVTDAALLGALLRGNGPAGAADASGMGTPAGPAPVAGPVDVVLHLAALIPPRADREPEAARLVNIEGTRTLVAAMERRRPAARLVHASSIAVYGDRVNRPLIEEADEPAPNPDDVYANQKLAAEWIVRTSSLDWYILRLSYVVAADALIMDPLLFEMPPETAVEPCPVEDVARAFVSAATMQAVRKRPSARKRSSVRNRPPAQATVESGERERIFLVAGGPGWRIMYRDYLDLMFRAFGLGRNSLPRAAFSDGPFHCGFMDTRRSQAILCYQRRDFGEFMEDLRRSRRLQRLMITAVRPIARAYLISRSPHFRRMLLEAGRPAVGRSAEGRAMNGRTAPAGVRTGTSRRAGMQLRRDIARLVMRLRTSLGLRLRLQKHL